MKKRSMKSEKSQGGKTVTEKACPRCGGSGWLRNDLPIDHPDFGKMVRCDCKKKEDARFLQEISRMTERERDVGMEDLVERGKGSSSLIESGKEFCKNPKGILTVYGGTGNAKSLLLQAVVNTILEKGKAAIYTTMFDLMGYIREAYDDDDDTALSRLDRFRTIPVLAIDEFDKVKTTDWVLSQVTSLVDRRHRDGLGGKSGTLIAMNADIETMPGWIFSRLTDGRNTLIHNTDSDLRSKL